MKALLFGTMSLAISKLTTMSYTDAMSLFDENNIKRVNITVELMDDSVHSFEVKDHFIEWENEE